jgi:chromate transporter
MILWRLTLFFLKIGAFTFGGGMAMIPFIHQELVEGLHWLSPEEFSEAIALGQITPGPVAISATFIGFKLAGLPGAVAATIAVFLPSFLMTVWASQQLERLRSNRALHAAVQGIALCVVGMLLAAGLDLARTTFTGGRVLQGLLVATIALLLSLYSPLRAVFIVLGAGIVGYLFL